MTSNDKMQRKSLLATWTKKICNNMKQKQNKKSHKKKRKKNLTATIIKKNEQEIKTKIRTTWIQDKCF